MKTVIIAGGKGTRISEIYPDIPKPMIPIDGVPVLAREIEVLRKQGFTDIILTVHHMAEKIMTYFGDGTSFGVKIEYFIEEKPLGNAGALHYLKDKLTEDFLIINADSMFNVDFERLIQFHRRNSARATILVHPNGHPYDSSLIGYDEEGRVYSWKNKEDNRPAYYHNLVNAGIHILSADILKLLPDKELIDLDRDILKPMVNEGKLFAYKSPEYVKDMGTPERLKQVIDDYESGIIDSKNLLEKQKAIFLDRDGTINKYVGFLTHIEDFELLPGVSDAIKLFHEMGYLVIVVTNQPVIARGEISLEELDEIHKKLETLLGREGAYIDDLFFCSHHPDRGFEGEVLKYKIDCECRKPKPGMLLKAAKIYNMDLSRSWMVGDGERDIKAGKNAGCKTCYLGEAEEKFCQDRTEKSLLDFATYLKEKSNEYL